MSSVFDRFSLCHNLLIRKIERQSELIDQTSKDVSEKEDDRQKQQNQILLSSKRFDQLKSLQAVELTVVLEQNRLSLMQEMHDQFAFDHSNINKILKLLKRHYR